MSAAYGGFVGCIDLSPQNRKIAPGSFLKNVFFSSTGVASALDIGHPMHPRCILVPLHPVQPDKWFLHTEDLLQNCHTFQTGQYKDPESLTL